jgi:hypothetical protein
LGLRANRRVRVTARSRQNERFPTETFSSIPRWQHPFQMKDTNWHRSEPLHLRVRMEAGRVGGGEVRGGHPKQAPPVGRRSAVGVDPTKKNLSYRTGNLGRSCASRWSAMNCRGHPANQTPLDTGRPSHGSRDREGAVSSAKQATARSLRSVCEVLFRLGGRDQLSGHDGREPGV